MEWRHYLWRHSCLTGKLIVGKGQERERKRGDLKPRDSQQQISPICSLLLKLLPPELCGTNGRWYLLPTTILTIATKNGTIQDKRQNAKVSQSSGIHPSWTILQSPDIQGVFQLCVEEIENVVVVICFVFCGDGFVVCFSRLLFPCKPCSEKEIIGEFCLQPDLWKTLVFKCSC